MPAVVFRFLACSVQCPPLWWQILNGRWIRANQMCDLTGNSPLSTLKVSRQIVSLSAFRFSLSRSVCGADESVWCISFFQRFIKIMGIKAWGDDTLLFWKIQDVTPNSTTLKNSKYRSTISTCTLVAYYRIRINDLEPVTCTRCSCGSE